MVRGPFLPSGITFAFDLVGCHTQCSESLVKIITYKVTMLGLYEIIDKGIDVEFLTFSAADDLKVSESPCGICINIHI